MTGTCRQGPRSSPACDQPLQRAVLQRLGHELRSQPARQRSSLLAWMATQQRCEQCRPLGWLHRLECMAGFRPTQMRGEGAKLLRHGSERSLASPCLSRQPVRQGPCCLLQTLSSRPLEGQFLHEEVHPGVHFEAMQVVGISLETHEQPSIGHVGRARVEGKDESRVGTRGRLTIAPSSRSLAKRQQHWLITGLRELAARADSSQPLREAVPHETSVLGSSAQTASRIRCSYPQAANLAPRQDMDHPPPLGIHEGPNSQ